MRTSDTFCRRYSHCPKPYPDGILRLIYNRKTYGSFTGYQKKNKIVVDNKDNEFNITGYFTTYPIKSLIKTERDLRVSTKNIHRILQK